MPQDDLRVEAWSRQLSEHLHAINVAKGIASKFIYMGDAGNWQNPYADFPSENFIRLRSIRASYDPLGIFARLNWVNLNWVLERQCLRSMLTTGRREAQRQSIRIDICVCGVDGLEEKKRKTTGAAYLHTGMMSCFISTAIHGHLLDSSVVQAGGWWAESGGIKRRKYE